MSGDYEIHTRLAYNGEIVDSTLMGNLYVIGDFDPEFMENDMDEMIRSVSASGISSVKGKLIGDVSMMDSVYWGPGWSWDDTPESFQPYYSPLMLNRGCVNVTVSPAANGERGEVSVRPESDYYSIDNKSVTMQPKAGGLNITRQWLTNSNKLIITGNVSRKSGRTVNMFDSKNMFMTTFRHKLHAKGITLDSDSIYFESVQRGVKHDVAGDSVIACNNELTDLCVITRPLRQVLKRALKESDNLSAEALFYHSARYLKKKHVNLTNKDGQEAIDLFLKKEIGADPDDYEIVDGSGVSLYNYISPNLLMGYLKYAYGRQDVFPLFFDALPVSGVDGTLKYRMYKTSAYRRIHAKTGTVSGISSLAGYAMHPDGRKYAFVIMNQNILHSRPAREFQDKVCALLME